MLGMLEMLEILDIQDIQDIFIWYEREGGERLRK